jgi:hypothetical protein
MTRVVIESPYKGDVERNLVYAKMAMLDSIWRGEAPFASHILYTQVLDDKVLAERQLGIVMGQAWLLEANLVAFYTDLGMSQGMKESLQLLKSKRVRVPFEIRKVNADVFDLFRQSGPPST